MNKFENSVYSQIMFPLRNRVRTTMVNSPRNLERSLNFPVEGEELEILLFNKRWGRQKGVEVKRGSLRTSMCSKETK